MKHGRYFITYFRDVYEACGCFSLLNALLWTKPLKITLVVNLTQRQKQISWRSIIWNTEGNVKMKFIWNKQGDIEILTFETPKVNVKMIFIWNKQGEIEILTLKTNRSCVVIVSISNKQGDWMMLECCHSVKCWHSGIMIIYFGMTKVQLYLAHE